ALDGDPSLLIDRINDFLALIKGGKTPAAEKKEKKVETEKQQYYLSQDKGAGSQDKKGYEATVWFEDGCEMENIRAYAIVHNLKSIVEDFICFPEDIIDDTSTAAIIREDGFRIIMRSEKAMQELHEFFSGISSLKAF